MPPRIGRPNYDKFRANEIGEVVKKILTCFPEELMG
jgi:hypothetical protein